MGQTHVTNRHSNSYSSIKEPDGITVSQESGFHAPSVFMQVGQMKKIHTLRLSAKLFSATINRTYLRTSVTLAILAVTSSPLSAHAQDKPSARFKFAPQYYPLEQPRLPRANYGSNVHFPQRNLQSVTSVKAGSVPNVNSMLGFNPSFIAQSTNTNVAWQSPALPVIPVQQPVRSAQPHSLPAFKGPRSISPQSAKPSVSKTISAQLLSSRKQPALNAKQMNSSSKPQRRPANPTKILKYDNGMFDPSSTHPGLYSQDSHATTTLSGKVLR